MNDILKKLNINNENYGSCVGGENWFTTSDHGIIESINPTTGELIAKVYRCSESDYDKIVSASNDAFEEWRMIPAPKRGELVYQISLKLSILLSYNRKYKQNTFI